MLLKATASDRLSVRQIKRSDIYMNNHALKLISMGAIITPIKRTVKIDRDLSKIGV